MASIGWMSIAANEICGIGYISRNEKGRRAHSIYETIMLMDAMSSAAQLR
jgi:hypothetical protein